MAVSCLPLENHPPQLMNLHLVKGLAIKREKPHCDIDKRNTRGHQAHGQLSHRFLRCTSACIHLHFCPSCSLAAGVVLLHGGCCPQHWCDPHFPTPSTVWAAHRASSHTQAPQCYTRATICVAQNGWRKDPGFPAIAQHLIFC